MENLAGKPSKEATALISTRIPTYCLEPNAIAERHEREHSPSNYKKKAKPFSRRRTSKARRLETLKEVAKLVSPK